MLSDKPRETPSQADDTVFSQLSIYYMPCTDLSTGTVATEKVAAYVLRGKSIYGLSVSQSLRLDLNKPGKVQERQSKTS